MYSTQHAFAKYIKFDDSNKYASINDWSFALTPSPYVRPRNVEVICSRSSGESDYYAEIQLITIDNQYGYFLVMTDYNDAMHLSRAKTTLEFYSMAEVIAYVICNHRPLRPDAEEPEAEDRSVKRSLICSHDIY